MPLYSFLSDLCLSECDKMSSLLVFYVDEKFTHQVIYLNTKSSIFLCQDENLHIKFITLLSDANFFLTKAVHICDQVSCFDIKFVIFAWNTTFSLPSELRFVEGIKNICQVCTVS